jgi:ankyrin repeat protein
MSAFVSELEKVKAIGDEWFLEKLRGMTIMTRIACKNRLDILLRILKRVNRNDILPDMYGNTCLHYFALRNNGPAYEELLSWGFSEDYKNNLGETPLQVKVSGSLSFTDGRHVMTFTPGVYT